MERLLKPAATPHTGKTGQMAAESPADRPPEPGDILLFYRATGLNRVITWFTRSAYYHVALYAGDHCVIEARPGGVIRRDLRGREGGHSYRVVPGPEGKGLDALRWAQERIGARYDRLDVVVIVLERVFRHLQINYTPRDRFSCGEFVALAYAEVGVTLFRDCRPTDAVPGDFARLLPKRPDENDR
jgi:hypothetical protein